MRYNKKNPHAERARRSYFFVDVGVTSCGTFLSGLRPTADQGCLYLAWTLGLLGLLHLAYLSLLRPVRTRLETVSMITMAISNVVSAAACIAALTQEDPSTKTKWTNVVSICLTFQLLHYFIASLTQGVWALIRAERRRALLLITVAADSAGPSTVSLERSSSDEQEDDGSLRRKRRSSTTEGQEGVLVAPQTIGDQQRPEDDDDALQSPLLAVGGKQDSKHKHFSNPLRR